MLTNAVIKLMIQNNEVYVEDDLLKQIDEIHVRPNAEVSSVYFNLESDIDKFIPIYAMISKGKGGFPLKRVDNCYYIDIGTQCVKIGFFDKRTAHRTVINNRLAGDIIRIKGDGHLSVVYSHNCKYRSLGKQCKFCNIHKWTSLVDGDFDDIVDVAYLYQEQGAIRHISISGGTQDEAGNGLREIVWLMSKLKDKGVQLPIHISFEPINDIGLLREFKSLGVKTV